MLVSQDRITAVDPFSNWDFLSNLCPIAHQRPGYVPSNYSFKTQQYRVYFLLVLLLEMFVNENSFLIYRIYNMFYTCVWYKLKLHHLVNCRKEHSKCEYTAVKPMTTEQCHHPVWVTTTNTLYKHSYNCGNVWHTYNTYGQVTGLILPSNIIWCFSSYRSATVVHRCQCIRRYFSSIVLMPSVGQI